MPDWSHAESLLTGLQRICGSDKGGAGLIQYLIENSDEAGQVSCGRQIMSLFLIEGSQRVFSVELPKQVQKRMETIFADLQRVWRCFFE